MKFEILFFNINIKNNKLIDILNSSSYRIERQRENNDCSLIHMLRIYFVLNINVYYAYIRIGVKAVRIGYDHFDTMLRTHTTTTWLHWQNTKEATIRNLFHTYANIKQFASAQNDTQKANYILKTLSLSTQKLADIFFSFFFFVF